MEVVYNNQRLDSLVRKIFFVEELTLGGHQQKFIVRYRGHLISDDSAAAYDQLAEWLKPDGLTPLFRIEENRQVILLVPGKPAPRPSNPWINLILFIVTLLSVLLAGGLYGMDEPLPAEPLKAVLALLFRGLPFAVSLIAILAAHEFGHYLAGRYHGVHVTLPYFIPFPFGLFGTLGAFINMKESPKNRRVLLDIGIAGPLAGLAVAIPVLLLGLMLSKVQPLAFPPPPGSAFTLEGNSVIYLVSKFLVFGKLLPAPLTYGGVSPLFYWIQFFFTGMPIPAGGLDVMLHPVAWAGWAGLLVTAMNLIPVGQLDGGHVMYVLFGSKRMKVVLPIILGILILLGLAWNGWWIWAFLIYFVGRSYAEPLDQITPLDGRRKILAIIALVAFILTFTPVPLSIF